MKIIKKYPCWDYKSRNIKKFPLRIYFCIIGFSNMGYCQQQKKYSKCLRKIIKIPHISCCRGSPWNKNKFDCTDSHKKQHRSNSQNQIFSFFRLKHSGLNTDHPQKARRHKNHKKKHITFCLWKIISCQTYQTCKYHRHQTQKNQYFCFSAYIHNCPSLSHLFSYHNIPDHSGKVLLFTGNIPLTLTWVFAFVRRIILYIWRSYDQTAAEICRKVMEMIWYLLFCICNSFFTIIRSQC